MTRHDVTHLHPDDLTRMAWPPVAAQAALANARGDERLKVLAEYGLTAGRLPDRTERGPG